MLNVEVGFMSEAWLMILQKVALDIFIYCNTTLKH